MHRFFAPALDPGDERSSLPREKPSTSRGCCGLAPATQWRCSTAAAASSSRESSTRARAATSPCSCCPGSSRPREPAVPLTLAQAVLKGDKMDDVVRDAVMLGVAAIQPIVTPRARDDARGALPRRARRALAPGRLASGSSAAAPCCRPARARVAAVVLARRGSRVRRLVLVEPTPRPRGDGIAAMSVPLTELPRC